MYKPSPSVMELSEMIIENNSNGIYQNLLELGFIDEGFFVNAKSVMDLYASIDFQSRDQALDFILRVFDVTINNNGKHASQLAWLVYHERLSLGQMAYNAWAKVTPDSPQPLESSNATTPTNTFLDQRYYLDFRRLDKFQTTVLVLAAVGFLFLVAASAKGIQKLFS